MFIDKYWLYKTLGLNKILYYFELQRWNAPFDEITLRTLVIFNMLLIELFYITRRQVLNPKRRFHFHICCEKVFRLWKYCFTFVNSVIVTCHLWSRQLSCAGSLARACIACLLLNLVWVKATLLLNQTRRYAQPKEALKPEARIRMGERERESAKDNWG